MNIDKSLFEQLDFSHESILVTVPIQTIARIYKSSSHVWSTVSKPTFAWDYSCLNPDWKEKNNKCKKILWWKQMNISQYWIKLCHYTIHWFGTMNAVFLKVVDSFLIGEPGCNRATLVVTSSFCEFLFSSYSSKQNCSNSLMITAMIDVREGRIAVISLAIDRLHPSY